MATLHSTITGADNHEPKGVESATSGTVYVANGSGSGSWSNQAAADIPIADTGNQFVATNVENALAELKSQDPHGWVSYTDTFYTGGTSLTISATAPGTIVPNNKGSAIESQQPLDLVNPMWNSTTNKFIPIRENDFYVLRLGFTISALSGTVDYVTLNCDIGGSVGNVFSETFVPRTVGEKFVFTIPIYTAATFLANGGQFYLLKQGTGTLQIQNIQFLASRTHRGR